MKMMWKSDGSARNYWSLCNNFKDSLTEGGGWTIWEELQIIILLKSVSVFKEVMFWGNMWSFYRQWWTPNPSGHNITNTTATATTTNASSGLWCFCCWKSSIDVVIIGLARLSAYPMASGLLIESASYIK